MDNEIQDRAAGWDQAAHDAGGDQTAPCDSARADTAPATRSAELTPIAAGFRIRFCTWCKQIDVRGPRRDTDVICILIIGQKILASWNAKPLIVQDGICEACAICLRDGKTISEGSTTL